jgi:hypothetical protein
VYTDLVYTKIVSQLKNITFSAEPELIERGRMRAQLERTTLNEEFRKWLDNYACRRPTVDEFDELMKSLRHVDTGRKFSREELNRRAAHK